MRTNKNISLIDMDPIYMERNKRDECSEHA